jgi:type IV pilus assembly protein PilX
MHNRNSQHGAALVLSLILLLMLTLIGLSSMRTSTMEEKMTSNMRDMDLAFEASESGLREAERWLDLRSHEPAADGSGFVYHDDVLPDLTTQDHSWWINDANTGEYSVAVPTTPPLPAVGDQPRFTVEFRAFIPDSLVRGYEPPKGVNIYRVTARGTGVTSTAQRIVQDTFVKRYN